MTPNEYIAEARKNGLRLKLTTMRFRESVTESLYEDTFTTDELSSWVMSTHSGKVCITKTTNTHFMMIEEAKETDFKTEEELAAESVA